MRRTKVEVHGEEKRGRKSGNSYYERLGREHEGKVKGPALPNRGQGTLIRLGLYARATRPVIFKMSAKNLKESTRIIDAKDGPGLDHGVGFLSHRDSPNDEYPGRRRFWAGAKGSLRLRLKSVEYYTPVALSYPGLFFEQRWREQATKEFLARC